MTEMVVQKKSFTDPVEIEQQADQRADDVLPSETSTGPFTPETKFDKLQWRYAQTVVKRPCICLSIAMLFVFVLGGIGGSSISFAPASDYDWTISDADVAKNLDAYTSAVSQIDLATGAGTLTSSRSQFYTSSALILVYKWKEGMGSGSIFTPVNLQEMCQVETNFYGPGYSEVCALYNGTTCMPQMRSVATLFYGTNSTAIAECALLPQTVVDSVLESKIIDKLWVPATRLDAGFYVGKDTLAANTSGITRSMMFVGTPMAGFAASDDRKREQSNMVRKLWATDFETTLWGYFGQVNSNTRSAYRDRAYTEHLEVVYYMNYFREAEFQRVVASDLQWVIGAVVFVLFYIGVHTGSLFITAIGTLNILMSLPVAFVPYRYIGQVTYFQQMHILSIFLCLGIGADNIFVFSDAFKVAVADARVGAGETDPGKLLLARVYYANRRTIVAVFNTALTTAMSFVATSASPIMPISAFGIFAAMTIVVNYLLSIFICPIAFAVLETYAPGGLMGPSCCGICLSALTGKGRRGAVKSEDDQPGRSRGEGAGDKVVALEVAAAAGGSKEASAPAVAAPTRGWGLGLAGCKDKKGAFSPPTTVEIFQYYYSPLMTHPVNVVGFKIPAVASVVALIFAVALGSSANQAMQLRTPQSQEEFFPKDHMHTGFGDMVSSSFMAAEASGYTNVKLVFGIGGLDRSAYNKWQPDRNRGTAIWDPGFDLSTRAAQAAYVGACQRIRAQKCNQKGCSGGLGLLARPGSPSRRECVLETLADSLDVPTTALPTGEAFVTALTAFRDSNYNEFGKQIGMVDGKLRFVTLPFTTTLLRNQPYETTNPVYLDCLDLVAAVKANSPTSMQALFSEGGRAWTWPVTERALVNNMFFGLALCFPVAFFVLLFATNNVIVSFFAILSIAAIVTSVLGFCRSSMGWDLGVAESIAAVIVIGFSVDYTVHLGHVYCESKAMTRAARMTDAATDMGVTVMGGAVTTMGAGLFMYGCQMTFFTKMATLITMTIVFSVLYSLGFFMSLCAVMGPVNGYGDVTVIVQWLKDKVRGKKE